ncbi:MAG: PadR family transcriptional regulator [Clostridiaceae bacterium]|nr:PadR family transcriptional regulator [Clostridiaceae bacterium]
MAFPISAALLDYCVLAIIARKDEYGYSITQRLQSVMNISESTLYPVLRRLQQAHFLETYDQPFQGRNRRYYRVTNKGIKQLSIFAKEWEEHKQMVDYLVRTEEGGDEHDEG